MKMTKMLEKLSRFLQADAQAQLKEIKSIRKLLKELKQKERELKEKLEKKRDQDETNELKMKLDVIFAQRKKGVERVKLLKAGLAPDTLTSSVAETPKAEADESQVMAAATPTAATDLEIDSKEAALKSADGEVHNSN